MRREIDENAEKSAGDVCPWDFPDPSERSRLQPSPSVAEDILTMDHAAVASTSRKNSTFLDSSSSSDVSMSVVAEVTERLKKTSCNLHETISRFSRRSSSAATSKQADSTRPSVSSTEDLTATPFRSFDSNPPGSSDKESGTAEENTPPATHSRRRSITALIGRKQSTSNTTPLISVSSVSEQSEEKAPLASCSNVGVKSKSLEGKPSAILSLKKAESMEASLERSSCSIVPSTSRDLKTDQGSDKPTETASSPNEVCPWEDE